MQTKAAGPLPAIKFGTDGWRGVIAHDFTQHAVDRVAQAYASFLQLKATWSPGVIIGYDNRFLSSEFAKRTAQILLANKIRVEMFAQPVPTPLVSFAVVNRRCAGGVVITASHNPPQYNGFKIKDSRGASAFDATTRAVEAMVDKWPVAPVDERTEVSEVDTAVKLQYFDHLMSLVDVECIRNAGLQVIVDPMHGTAGKIIEDMVRGGKTQATTIRASRDCLFGGTPPEPIDKHLGELKRKVATTNASIGVATDGDADRLGAVNELGQTMTMHEVAPVLLHHLIHNRCLEGSVVATVTQSVLLKRMAAAYGLRFVETPVGFKHIACEMLSGDVLIGAEESGGIGVKGHIPERDGILNGLLLLEAIARSGATPTQLVAQIHSQFGEFYYDRVDLPMSVEQSDRFLKHLVKHARSWLADTRVTDINTVDGVKILLTGDSWFMFRRSGTEPVIRLYAESSSKDKTGELLHEGTQLVGAFVQSFQTVSPR